MYTEKDIGRILTPLLTLSDRTRPGTVGCQVAGVYEQVLEALPEIEVIDMPTTGERLPLNAAQERVSVDVEFLEEEQKIVTPPKRSSRLQHRPRSFCERGSLIITSNRAVEEWYPLFHDDLLASAALDRFLHHAYVLTLDGNSYRNPPGQRAIEPAPIPQPTAEASP